MPFPGTEIAMSSKAYVVYGYDEAEDTVIGGKDKDLADKFYRMLTYS